MNKFKEDDLEKSIIQLFEERGYLYTNGSDICRKYTDILLEDDLKDYLTRKYSSYNITDSQLVQIINKIKHTQQASLYDSSKYLYNLIDNGFDLLR